MSTQVGDMLVSRGVTLGTMYAGTEFPNPAIPSPLCNPNPNWSWLEFTSQTVELEWDSQGDGTYELIIRVRYVELSLVYVTYLSPNVRKIIIIISPNTQIRLAESMPRRICSFPIRRRRIFGKCTSAG